MSISVSILALTMAHRQKLNGRGVSIGVLLVVQLFSEINAIITINKNEGYEITDYCPSGRIRITPFKKIDSNCHGFKEVSISSFAKRTSQYPEIRLQKFGYWKISVQILATLFCDRKHSNEGDSLRLYNTRRVRKTSMGESITWEGIGWRHNVSYKSLESGDPEEVHEVIGKEMEIVPLGEWRRSAAELLVSLYKDPVGGECPEDLFTCFCSDKFENITASRCISKGLMCDGVPNCGHGCRYDEDNCTFRKNPTKFYDMTIFSSCKTLTTKNSRNIASFSHNAQLVINALTGMVLNKLIL